MYRKFSADHIFNGYHFLPVGTVVITTADGFIEAVIDRSEAGEEVQHFNGILCPGFINAHCHLELSHLKGSIAKHTGLVSFVQQVMAQRTADDEIKQQAMTTAAAAMYDSGIVAVGDICNTTDSIAVKQQSKIRWHNFIEVSGFENTAAEQRLAAANKIRDGFTSLLPMQASTLSPHAPYSVSKSLFQLLDTATAHRLISIHNQESKEEDKLYKNKSGNFLELYKSLGIDISGFSATGKSSIQSWLPYFTQQQCVLLVHNTFMSSDDIRFAKASAVSPTVVLCPAANKYIEGQLPPLELLLQYDINIVTGTDSLASNDALDILQELKILQNGFPQLTVETLLQFATSNASKALQMDNILGSFNKGKQPGVVHIANADQHILPASATSKKII